MRMSLLHVDDLDPELREGLTRWLAEGGDPNFYRLFGRLPERLKHFIRFYSPLVRRGLVEHRTKELSGFAGREKTALRYADRMSSTTTRWTTGASPRCAPGSARTRRWN